MVSIVVHNIFATVDPINKLLFMKSEFDYFLLPCTTYYNMIHQCDVYNTTQLCTQNSSEATVFQ